MTDRDSVDRCRAFLKWWAAEHAQEIETATAAILAGKQVRLTWDAEKQRVTATPVESQ